MKAKYVQWGMALLVLSVSLGCARRTVPGATTTPNTNYNSGYNNTTNPYNNTTPNTGYTSTPGYNTGYNSTPGYNGTSGYNNTSGYYGGSSGYGMPGMAAGRLTATVQKTQNGTFLGIGKFTVTVMVNNPSQTALSGQLQVNFTDGGKSVKTITDRVQVGPGQSVTRTFEDPSWKIDSATVNVTTDQTSLDPTMGGMNTGFGQTNQYNYPY